MIAVLLRVSARIGMGWQAGRTPDRLEADLADLADHPKDKVTGECVGEPSPGWTAPPEPRAF